VTTTGIKGYTQGVRLAINPAMKLSPAARKIDESNAVCMDDVKSSM
jgi:hypothetical protein